MERVRFCYPIFILVSVGLVFLACGSQSQNSPTDQAVSVAQEPPEAPPPWAYILGPEAEPRKDDGAKITLPGSSASYTWTEVRSRFDVADWHPNDHPPMPDFVAHGRKPEIWGCGYCHQPNGLGRPENAPLAGLPVDYVMRQMADFKSGSRESSGGEGERSRMMTKMATHATDAEVRQAAEYFSSLEHTPWVRVVETETVPKTHEQGMWVPIDPPETEPSGLRIIEVPEDVERTAFRDPRSGFIAYVPVGSLAKGEVLVRTGGDRVVDGEIERGRTVRCGTCHGDDLKGIGNVPGIAGRSPSYVVRQLYDIQKGNRKGPWNELMKEAVARLSEEDMVAIAAYTASLAP